jgi:rfaE bifunctional protein kinase chain/domain
MLKTDKLTSLLKKLPQLRFGILGDFCLDAYFFIDPSVSELSVETGLSTLPVARTKYSLGGAGNVAKNIADLGGGEILCFGVLGDDPFSPVMTDLLEKSSISSSHLQVQEQHWHTHVYTKIIKDKKELPRIDFGNVNELAGPTAQQLLEDLENSIPGLDILIINQQVLKGVHTQQFRKNLVTLLDRYPKLIVITDSRSFSDDFSGTIRKINDREAAYLCEGTETGDDTPVDLSRAKQYGKTLFKRWQKPVFLTRGDRGCIVCDKEGIAEVPGIMVLTETDTVGAGDSMLAGIAAALAAGEGYRTAAEVGNLTAGATVTKRNETGSATPSEIVNLNTTGYHRYNPELASMIHMASYYRNTDIEVVTSLPENPTFTHVIFDHDGTISTVRQGWEEVMEPMMVSAILGGPAEEVSEDEYRNIRETVRNYIDLTTGVQTLVQMKGLIDMVRKFGYVPEEEVRDEHGYKAVYNEALMKNVDDRIDRFLRGEHSIHDYVIKNSVEFLRNLSERGLVLYLASGTDEADLKREAEVLGYADFFEDRMYGATADINYNPKKKVIRTIFEDIKTGGNANIITFGDGPVEIQETIKAGGFGVGVASNEVRRFGLQERKRTRLIEAGANIIIPDFSQLNDIITVLFGET